MKQFFSVKKLALLGVLLALNVVLGYYSIHTLDMKIGFAFVTLACAAALFGPVEAALIGALGDVLGFVVNPIGMFFPGYTITAALTGLVFGLFLRRKITWPKLLLAVAINQFLLGLCLNTFFIAFQIMGGVSGIWPTILGLLPKRALQAVILFVVQTLVIWIMDKALFPLLRRFTEGKDADGNP